MLLPQVSKQVRNFIQSNLYEPSIIFFIQFRRAKVRKREHTKKGPGRPAHNAHPQTCSGEPIPPEEIKAREK